MAMSTRGDPGRSHGFKLCVVCCVVSRCRSFVEKRKRVIDENISWRPAERRLYYVKIFLIFYWVRKVVGVPVSWKMATLKEFSDN